MKNNKGVSIIALIITIIVFIILASIIIANSTETIDKSAKAVFQGDFKNAIFALQSYNTEAVLRANNPNYVEWDLQWDGDSEYAENSARIQDPTQDDTINYILKDHLTKDLRGKIHIVDGKLFVRPGYTTEAEWAKDLSEAFDPSFNPATDTNP